MAEGGDPSERIHPEYYSLPLIALRTRTRSRLSLHLNPYVVSNEDWRDLGEKIGMEVLEIKSIEQYSRNPTANVLNKAIQDGYTVGEILEILRQLNRVDILFDCGKMIEEDATAYRRHELDEVLELKDPLTYGELRTGEEEYFDAFVTFHTDDHKFVKEMSGKLEKELGFKLCIPHRDFCIGLVENEATAELIRNRCKRVIVVLSKSYVGMVNLQAKLRWQLRVAATLAPAIRQMHKLVPVVIDPEIRIPEDVPDVLMPYNVCEYNKPSLKDWFWERVEGSLDAPTSNSSGYLGPPERLGTKVNNTDTCDKRRPQTNHTESKMTSTEATIHREIHQTGATNRQPKQQARYTKINAGDVEEAETML